MEDGDEDAKAAEDPLEDGVDSLKGQRRRRHIAKSFLILRIPQSHIKFEKSSIDEVRSQCEEPQLEREFEAHRDVLLRRGEAGHVRSERHHCVEREQESVEVQASDIVDSLVEQEAPERRFLSLPYRRTEATRLGARVALGCVIGPA